MAISNLGLVIKKTRQDLLKEKRSLSILIAVLLFAILSIAVGFTRYADTNKTVQRYRDETRQNWEKRPDKHPHRMAHYGYMVFRNAHPLQIFDGGIDDFLGNVIFLEAHKQNTANLSEAGSSGTLVRFGTFSSAFILQNIVPLIVMFLGFGLVARERENATLKLLHVQGLSARTIIWGKVLGLWQFSLLFVLPIIPIVLVATLLLDVTSWSDVLLRLVLLLPAYMVFYFFISTLTVIISARSRSAATALVGLIGCWLFMVLFLPKGIQFLAQNAYPTPSRIAFETKVEEEVLKVGDSHNSDDPHFKHLKDSLLAYYKVKTTQELPINYSGVVMKEGERISSKIYADHLKALEDQYHDQQEMTTISGFVNPVVAIKNLSMLAAGTDYFAYEQFKQQAERYRYQLAQHMNELQIQHIANVKGEKPAVVNQSYWKQFPQFRYQFVQFGESIKSQWLPLLASAFWLLLSIWLIETSSKKLKLI